jgi:hypothetical protein
MLRYENPESWAACIVCAMARFYAPCIYAFLCSSRAEIAYKKNKIQNLNAASRPSNVLSNGELVFRVNLILCTETLIQLFTETLLAFNLHFQHI